MASESEDSCEPSTKRRKLFDALHSKACSFHEANWRVINAVVIPEQTNLATFTLPSRSFSRMDFVFKIFDDDVWEQLSATSVDV